MILFGEPHSGELELRGLDVFTITLDVISFSSIHACRVVVGGEAGNVHLGDGLSLDEAYIKVPLCAVSMPRTVQELRQLRVIALE